MTTVHLYSRNSFNYLFCLPAARKKSIIHSWLNDFQYHLRRKITYVTRSKLIELLYRPFSIQIQSKRELIFSHCNATPLKKNWILCWTKVPICLQQQKRKCTAYSTDNWLFCFLILLISICPCMHNMFSRSTWSMPLFHLESLVSCASHDQTFDKKKTERTHWNSKEQLHG